MTTNLFVIANVKQLRTDGSFRILLPFFRTSWGAGVLNSAIFNSFHNRVEFGTILEGLRNFGGRGGGGFEHPKPPPSVRHCLWLDCRNGQRFLSPTWRQVRFSPTQSLIQWAPQYHFTWGEGGAWDRTTHITFQYRDRECEERYIFLPHTVCVTGIGFILRRSM